MLRSVVWLNPWPRDLLSARRLTTKCSSWDFRVLQAFENALSAAVSSLGASSNNFRSSHGFIDESKKGLLLATHFRIRQLVAVFDDRTLLPPPKPPTQAHEELETYRASTPPEAIRLYLHTLAVAPNFPARRHLFKKEPRPSRPSSLECHPAYLLKRIL